MPTWKDLRRYLERNGYTQIKQGGDHFWYEKSGMPRVKISHGTGEIENNLWRHICKQQLQIDPRDFNKKK